MPNIEYTSKLDIKADCNVCGKKATGKAVYITTADFEQGKDDILAAFGEKDFCICTPCVLKALGLTPQESDKQ